MRTRPCLAALLVLTLLTPAPAHAWGFTGHRLIMARAIDLLPAELKPFFERFRDEVVIRVIDPDLWRNAGWEDDPNHFIDYGMSELGPFPFTALPHEYDRALAKFGQSTMKRVGMLPWREAEMFGNLRRGMDSFNRQGLYATTDVIYYAAVASHYIQDAHQPFHASNNYDGQLTGNNGIHARFERDLIEKFESRLTLRPAAPKPIADPREAAFAALLDSYQMVDAILAAHTEAVAGKDVYDDDYFEKFFAKTRSMLEKRLSDAIAATAGVIIGAWEAAGKPVLKTTDARPPQKVKK